MVDVTAVSALAAIVTSDGRVGMGGCGRDCSAVGGVSGGVRGAAGRGLIAFNFSERPWTSREEDGATPWGLASEAWRPPLRRHHPSTTRTARASATRPGNPREWLLPVTIRADSRAGGGPGGPGRGGAAQLCVRAGRPVIVPTFQPRNAFSSVRVSRTVVPPSSASGRFASSTSANV